MFIVPDTWLYLRLHRRLRQHLVGKGRVEQVVMFPSRFFQGVSFGYAKLCVVTLSRPGTGNTRLIDGLTSPTDLQEIARDRLPAHCVVQDLPQERLGERTPLAPSERDLTHHAPVGVSLTTVGQVADVVTGFYCGNDRRWLRVRADSKRGRGYLQIDESLVADASQYPPSIDGLPGQRRFIPLVRGGAIRYLKDTDWYVDWNREAVSDYRRPQPNPARFQNSRYYFREGLAVPMVRSRKMTAALLGHRLFDQSIVGVFPHDESLLYYLLAYFNSALCSRLMNQVNASANNSANYVKSLPLPLLPSKEVGESPS